MAPSRRTPGLRVRALLAALLVYALGVLSIQSASHAHVDGASHGSCQLCQASVQACEVPVPALAPAPPPVTARPSRDDSPRVLRALPPAYESRGPPSA